MGLSICCACAFLLFGPNGWPEWRYRRFKIMHVGQENTPSHFGTSALPGIRQCQEYNPFLPALFRKLFLQALLWLRNEMSSHHVGEQSFLLAQRWVRHVLRRSRRPEMRVAGDCFRLVCLTAFTYPVRRAISVRIQAWLHTAKTLQPDPRRNSYRHTQNWPCWEEVAHHCVPLW